MKRAVLLVLASCLAWSIVKAQAQEANERRDHIARVVVLSGLGERGPSEAERMFEIFSEYRWPTEERRSRHERVLAALRAEATADAYGARAAPVLEAGFSDEESRRLSEIFADPLVQRWLEGVRKHEKQLEAIDEIWRDYWAKEYFDRFAAPR